MAGFYADVPGHRLALDKDGTQWFRYTAAGVGTPLTSGEITTVNDWTAGGPDPGQGGWVAAVFPDKRDIAGVLANTSRSGALSGTATVETSLNTTNGLDGAWVSLTTFTEGEFETPIGMSARTGIKSAAALGVKGIRLKHVGDNGGGQMTFNVYGSVTAGQPVDRLAFWHPTLDQELTPAYLDWGDVPRNTNETRQLRVKNLSAAKTANTPRVALDALTDGSPSVVGQHAVSTDNATWLSQVNLSSLAPGAISPVVYVKRTTPLTAQPSIWSIRVFAEATTWS
jgi:hypothetical protein